MSNLQLFFLTTGLLATLFLTPVIWRHHERRKLFSTPFPEEWNTILEHQVGFYSRLNNQLKTQLQKEIQLFLFDKEITGCEGLQITDEIRLLIAAQACLLLINHPTNGYNKLRWIYVFPSSFINRQQFADENGVISNQQNHLLGESWQKGRIILSWDDVKKGLADFTDGHNVTLHEFAHQLDSESGATNGAPLLSKNSSYQTWAKVLSHEFEILQKQASNGEYTLIDTYGATNPAEFFAVATETFFERPNEMYQNHQQLFEQLQNYYQLDPREWTEN